MKRGRCVICGQVGALTDDHVPPRGVVQAVPLEIARLTSLIRVAAESHRAADGASIRRGYQAPFFRTLCSTCSSERLGSRYDPALIAFANGVARWMRAAHTHGLVLPPIAKVDVEPALVARALVGHLLAAEERKDRMAAPAPGTLPAAMRAYFLDDAREALRGQPETAPATGFRVFVWPYAASDVVIARGIGLLPGPRLPPLVGDVLKFFPLAFWVMAVPDVPVRLPVAELALDRWDRETLSLPMRDVPPPTWPERPQDHEMLLFSDDRTHIARRAGRRRRGS